MSRQIRRAMERAKIKQLRLQPHAMSPELRLARLEQVIAAVVQDVQTIVHILHEKKIIEPKTESGLWVPPTKG